MRYTFEEEFRLDHPETVGETDSHFDLDNYKDWLEAQLIEARKQLALCNVSDSLLSFEQCLREEFLVNTQNYPKEYHNLFHQKFERAEKRFREQSGNDR